MSNLPESLRTALEVLKTQFPLAIWETVYVTLLSTFFAILIGLPLGVLLVAGEDGKILRVPRWLLHVLNVVINLLRSVPFWFSASWVRSLARCWRWPRRSLRSKWMNVCPS